MKFKSSIQKILLTALFLTTNHPSFSQGIFVVSQGASNDSSVFSLTIPVTSDTLVFIKNKNGNTNNNTFPITIFDSKTHIKTGSIKPPENSFSVVGNINEYQVSVSSMEFETKKNFKDTNGILDKTNLISLVLLQARSAREAIAIIQKNTIQYGYYGKGLVLNINDPIESWIMELCPKGIYGKGTVWVALKIPNGYVSLLRPISRIQNFPLNDKENCLYSPDIEDVFKNIQGKESLMLDFRNTVSEISAEQLIYEESMIHEFYKYISTENNIDTDISFFNATKTLPLWVKPDIRFSLYDIIQLNQYLVNSGIAREENGCNISQSRNWFPNFIGGIYWTGSISANYFSLHPIYCGVSRLSQDIVLSQSKSNKFNKDQERWLIDFISTGMNLLDSINLNKVENFKFEQQELILKQSLETDVIASELYIKSAKNAQEFLNTSTEQMYRTFKAKLGTNAGFIIEKTNNNNLGDANEKELWFFNIKSQISNFKID